MLHVLKKNRKWFNQPMDVEGRMLSLPPSKLQPLSKEREQLGARPITPQKKATSPHHQILGKKSSHFR